MLHDAAPTCSHTEAPNTWSEYDLLLKQLSRCACECQVSRRRVLVCLGRYPSAEFVSRSLHVELRVSKKAVLCGRVPSLELCLAYVVMEPRSLSNLSFHHPTCRLSSVAVWGMPPPEVLT